MTEDELKQLEAMTEAATPGPWRAARSTVFAHGGPLQVGQGIEIAVCEGDNGAERHANSKLMAAARTAIPSLIAALRAERRRAEVAEARAHYWRSRVDVADLEHDHDQLLAEKNFAMAERTQDRIADADAVVAEAHRAIVALGVLP